MTNQIHNAILDIQKKGITKNVKNEFGGFKYLKISTIMNEIADILDSKGLRIKFEDTIKNIGDRYYIEATATMYDSEGKSKSARAYAREVDTKKGMDMAQITGSCSTYARKYALCGLLGLEGEEDVDARNNTSNDTGTDKPRQASMKQKEFMKSLNKRKNVDLPAGFPAITGEEAKKWIDKVIKYQPKGK